MNLKAINLEKYVDKSDGWHEIDLYPERAFENETVDILLYENESCGNVEYYYFFDYCDKNDIKIRVFTTFNMLPVASLLGHVIILQPPPTDEQFLSDLYYQSKITRYVFDRHYAWEKYNVKRWSVQYGALQACPSVSALVKQQDCSADVIMNQKDLQKNRTWAPWVKRVCWKSNLYQLALLCEEVKNRTTIIDSRGLDLFLENKNEFPSDGLWVEYSRQLKEQCNFMNWIVKKCNIPVYVASKNRGWQKGFQEKIILNNEGSKYLLTYQMLCSLYNNVKFVGIGGVASLFSISPFINCSLMSDAGFNVDHAAGYFKSILNLHVFDQDTYNFPICYGRAMRTHSMRIRSSYGMLDKNRLEFVKTVVKNLNNEKVNVNFKLTRTT